MTDRTNTTRAGVWGLVAGMALMAATSMAMAQSEEYWYMEIGTLGGPSSEALAINERGKVVGCADRSDRPADYHAFLWDGEIHDLGSLGTWSMARDINNLDVVVGSSMTSDGEEHAFVYMDGVMHDLNELVGLQSGPVRVRVPETTCLAPLRVLFEANAINDFGMIAACGYVWADDAPHGYLLVPQTMTGMLDQPYAYVDLGRLPKADDCIALDVNASGEVVGKSGGRAFVWSEGEMSELELVGTTSEARAINDAGDVVGWTMGYPGPVAAVWTAKPTALDTPTGWESMAFDLDEHGTAVGWLHDVVMPPPLSPAAAVWVDGEPVNLNYVTWIPMIDLAPWVYLEQAEAINEAGQITGFGRLADGNTRAFVLYPFSQD